MGHTIVVPTEYGPLIVNRNDFNQANELMKTGRAVDHREIMLLGEFMIRRGGVFVDAGGCFGTFAIPMARAAKMVHVFEGQPVLCNMIAGAAALNSLSNVRCHNVVLSDWPYAVPSQVELPQYDYDQPMNFGSVEFGGEQTEMLHQARGTDPEKQERVEVRSLDSYHLQNVTAMKIDVEGMEAQVVAGAKETIQRDRPILYIEIFKSSFEAVRDAIPKVDYSIWQQGDNLWALPQELLPLFVKLCPMVGLEVIDERSNAATATTTAGIS